MTKDEIIRTLRESCDKDKQDAWQNGFWVITQEELERFAKLVSDEKVKGMVMMTHDEFKSVWDKAQQEEREACAEICKKQADVYAALDQNPTTKSAWAACIDNRDTIRARGQA